MNPFLGNITDGVTESDLIAFHLDELSPRRARAVRRALERSSSLALTSTSVLSTLTALKDTPLPVDRAVLDHNWEVLRSSLITHGRSVDSASRWRWPLFALLLLSGIAAISLFVNTREVPPPPEYRHAVSGPVTQKPGPIPIPNHEPGRNGHLSKQPSHPPHLPGSTLRALLPQAQPPNPALDRLALNRDLAAPPSSPPVLPPRRELVQLPMPLSATPVRVQPLSNPVRSSGPAKPPGLRTSDLMFGMGGSYIVSHHSLTAGTEPRSQTTSPSFTVLASFHQQFHPSLGYRITASYTRPDFTYAYSGSSSASSFSAAGTINSSIFEAASTYVISGPHRGRLTTSADAGAALLAFVPHRSDHTVSYAYRGAGVLGVNADYAISSHWGVRALYRAQVFRTPDFRYSGGIIPVTRSVVFGNDSSLGITYQFGRK